MGVVNFRDYFLSLFSGSPENIREVVMMGPAICQSLLA
jgi:hypothetical protein